MVDAFNEPLRVVAAFKKLPGGSQSTLIQCDDGNAYVVKTHPNPQGLNVLANESIGTHLLQGLEIVSPICRPVLITNGDIQRYAALRGEARTGAYIPTAGLHFGSMYLGSLYNEITEMKSPWLRHNAVNQDDFFAVYLIDLWAQHQDKRQYFYVTDVRSGEVKASFFDNGHLFGGPNWLRVSKESVHNTPRWHKPPNVEPGELEGMITTLKHTVPDLLSEIIPSIPATWYSGDIRSLERMLLFRLSMLRELVDNDYQEYAKAMIADQSAFH